jgi:hypothetical protein
MGKSIKRVRSKPAPFEQIELIKAAQLPELWPDGD